MYKTSEKSNRRRELILIYLFDYSATHKYPPTIRQIKDNCGTPSTSVTNYYLDRLQADGLVNRERKISRGTYLTKDGEDKVRKLLGIKQGKLCPHCYAPVDKDGKFQPPTKIQNKINRQIHSIAT